MLGAVAGMSIILGRGQNQTRGTGESKFMVSAGRRLGHVEPRERAGAQTGRKYEYQYERTARAQLWTFSPMEPHTSVYTATGTMISLPR